MRILVTGASGFLGSHTATELSRDHDVLGLTFRTGGRFPFPTAVVDLTEEAAVGKTVAAFRPSVIVHAAAMSRVLECENDPPRAWAINVDATECLVRSAEQIRAKFVFISSDQVFPGSRGGYRESDQPGPVGVYGRTKLDAEYAVLQSTARHIVLRSNSIVGASIGWGESFTTRILNSVNAGQRIGLFHDQYRSPIHVRTLVRIIEAACSGEMNGLLHAGGPKRMSRLDAGYAALRAAGIAPDLVDPVSYLSHPGAPFMTRDTSYDISRLLHLLRGTDLPSLDEELARDALFGGKTHESPS